MKPYLGSLLILSPLAILLLANCEARSPGTSAEFTPKASLGAAHGLDTNDVSILVPLPSDRNGIAKMLPLAFNNDDGTTPMTATLFADIISHHKYTDLTDGKKTPLNSGARFDGKGRIKEESRTFGPYDQLNDWRIISLRFDPCAPSPTQNLRGHGSRQNPAAFNLVQCLPQLRLITQPVFDKEREESRFDGPVMVGDYAIHLLFTLSEMDVKAVYQELAAFRDSCGDMTSSMPLGVHPCLVAAKNRGAYGGDEFQKVYGLIKRFAKQLDAVAMMATQSGDDPWVFMNGFVKNGAFLHIPVDSVREDDLSKLKEGKNGNILAPFGNGFYQQVSFLDVTVRDRGQPAPRQKPVSPDVQPQKVNAFLTNELIVGKSIWDRKTADAAAAVFNQVENPLAVDFFSTDCVSCHVVSSARDLFYKETPTVLKDKIIAGTESLTPYFTDPNFLDFSTDAFQRTFFTNGYRAAPFYTNIVDGFTRSQPKEIVAATLLNFGYRGAKPQVSPRTANESALVAETANRFFNNGTPPAPSCPIEPLRQCLLTAEMVTLNQSPGFMISHCLRQLCPERIKTVRSIFGDDVSHRYRLKADVPVVGSSSKFAWDLEKNPAVLKKGSVVHGRVEQDPWSPTKFVLLTPDVLSVERQGAKLASMRAAAGCFFEATDADKFERLE